MKMSFNSLKGGYIFFIISILILVAAYQIIIQYDLNKKTDDARLINIAGRQRMLSQRISKINLLILYEYYKYGEVKPSLYDSLDKVINQFAEANKYLIKRSADDINSSEIDTLLARNQFNFSQLISQSAAVLENRSKASSERAVDQLRLFETPFLSLMERTVNQFQHEAEENLRYIQRVELILGAITFIIILCEFLFIFLPTLRKAKAGNEMLLQLNKELISSNSELISSEEEIKSNLDQISELQRHLEASEKQYRELVEQAGDMIYDMNDVGKFSFVNQIMENLTGYYRIELMEMTYLELIHPDHRERVLEFYVNQRKAGKELSYLEFPIVDRHGKLIWVGQNVRMFYNENWVWKVSAIARDITNIKKIEAELRESKDRFMSLAENAPVGIFLATPDGRTTYFNKRWFEITGIMTNTTQTERIERIHPEDQDRVYQEWKSAVDNKSEFSSEYRYIHPQRGVVWVNGKTTLLVDKDDQVNGFIGTISDITEVKVIQERLAESEKLYRILSTNTNDLICLHDYNDDATYIYVSPSSTKLTGYAPEELIGKSPFSIMPEDDAIQMRLNAHSRTMRGESALNTEFRLRRKDGSIIWMEANSHPITDGHGNLLYFQTASRNITERKKIETALLSSEQRFKSLAEDAPIGIYQTDANGHAVYTNKRWCYVAGLSKEKALGQGWTSVIHVNDKDKVSKAWITAMQESTEFNIEHRFVNPKLGVRWVSNHSIQIFEPDGALGGFIGTVQDITELKRAQEKIEESERLYRLISTNSRDLIFLYSNDSVPRCIYASPSAREILGYDAEEMIGRPPFDLVVDEDVEHVRSKLLPIRLDGSSAHIEYRIRRKDGIIIWLESNSHLFFDDDGKMSGFQTSARDITQRKSFEEALLSAKVKAEEATLAKSQFLSMMSHEIRTPMNAIIGLTNLLLEDEPRNDQRESLDLLKFSGENLLTIINDILDFSKIEAGKIEFEFIDFDLQLLLENTVRMLNHRAHQKGLELTFSYPDEAPRIVVSDPVRIAQIITNLVGNAIKFTERGMVTLDVKLQDSEVGSNLYNFEFAIIDTGIGIEKDKVNKIFESFTQARNDTTRKFGGTGLGLSITKRLLDLLGSDIQVESEINIGSKFFFTLQLKAGAITETNHKKVGDFTALFKTKSYHILLAEDNQINQIVATNFLKKWGLEVTIANNGLEVLELVKRKNFHLVLMDLQMPEMDGYEATRMIRAMTHDPYFINLPIIALTASAMLEIKEKIYSTGMNDFVSKPFQPEDLQLKISQYLLQQEELEITPAYDKIITNLDMYADGDVDFRRELTAMVKNHLDSLQNGIEYYLSDENSTMYLDIFSKAKTTLSMLGDEHFLTLAADLERIIKLKSPPHVEKNSVIQMFLKRCREIVSTLEEEMSNSGL